MRGVVEGRGGHGRAEGGVRGPLELDRGPAHELPVLHFQVHESARREVEVRSASPSARPPKCPTVRVWFSQKPRAVVGGEAECPTVVRLPYCVRGYKIYRESSLRLRRDSKVEYKRSKQAQTKTAKMTGLQ